MLLQLQSHAACQAAANAALGRSYPTEAALEPFSKTDSKFRVGLFDSLFFIGSDLAREAEVRLSEIGYQVPSLSFAVPPHEYPYMPSHGILNKESPPLIAQELAWLTDLLKSGQQPSAANCLRFWEPNHSGSSGVDTNLEGFVPVSLKRFVERRRSIFELLKQLAVVDHVLISLSTNEAWFDLAEGRFVQRVPRGNFPNERYVLRVLSRSECTEHLERSLDSIRELNPRCRFILFVCPLPRLYAHLRPGPSAADSEIKNLLDGACNELRSRYNDVEYWPICNKVTFSGHGSSATYLRRRMMTRQFSGKMLRTLTASFFEESSRAELLMKAASAAASGNHSAAFLFAAKTALPEDPVVLSLKAHSLIEKKKYNEAADLLAKAEADKPIAPEVLNALAHLAHRKGHYESAVKHASRAVRLMPSDYRCRCVYARSLTRSGRRAEAEMEFLSALRTNPLAPAVYPAFIRFLSLCGRRSDARFCLWQARTISRHNVDHLISAAEIQLRAGRHDLAERIIRRAAKLAPSIPALLIARSRCASDAGHPEESTSYLRTAARLQCGDPAAVLSSAELLSEFSDVTAADYFAFAVECNGENAELLEMAATFCLRSNQVNRALEYASSAARHFPRRLSSILAEARCLNRAGKRAEAIQAGRKALVAVPASTGALAELAGVLAECPEGLTDALQLMERALEVSPDNGKLLAQYGRLLLSQGRSEEAEQQFRKGVESSPSDAACFLSLIQLKLGEKRLEEALDWSTSAMRACRSKELAAAHIRALVENKQWERAKESLADALLRYPKFSPFENLKKLIENRSNA